MIIVTTLLLGALVALRAKSVFNPVSMMIVWWGGWLYISIFQFTGISNPSFVVQRMTLTFVLGLAMGAIAGSFWRPRTFSGPIEPEPIVERFLKAQRPIVILTALMVVPAFIRGLQGLIRDPISYRSIAFSTLESPGFVFGSATLESLYFLVSPPLILFLLLFGIALYFQAGRFSALGWALLFTLMDSVMRLARINLYLTVLLAFAGGVVILAQSNGKPGGGSIAKRFGLAISGLVAVGAIVVGIGVVRNDRNARELRQQFEVFVVDYHTIGFALIDTELANPASDLNVRPTYGRLTFGGLESLLTIVIRRFDREYNSPALANAVRMTANVQVGRLGNEPKLYNSFYTILYTFYSDARYLGLLIGGMVLGWLTFAVHRWWGETRRLEALVYALFLLSIVLLGIFVSPLENTRTWLVGLGLLTLRLWPRIEGRLKSLAPG